MAWSPMLERDDKKSKKGKLNEKEGSLFIKYVFQISRWRRLCELAIYLTVCHVAREYIRDTE